MKISFLTLFAVIASVYYSYTQNTHQFPPASTASIGRLNPDSKLVVNNTIHFRFISIDLNDWSGYVLEKEYQSHKLSIKQIQVLACNKKYKKA